MPANTSRADGEEAVLADVEEWQLNNIQFI
jgi:hypothetical protein